MAYTAEATFISAREVRIKVSSTVSDSLVIIQKPASLEMIGQGITLSNVVGFRNGAFRSGIGILTLNANTEGSATINYPTDVDEVLFMLVYGTGYDSTIQQYESYINKSMPEGADALFDSLATDGYPVFIRSTAQPLPTPTGLNATNVTSNSARTNWQAVENASNYKVQYKAAGDTVWTETYTD